jgi:hypothetical protein
MAALFALRIDMSLGTHTDHLMSHTDHLLIGLQIDTPLGTPTDR